jgi:beta-fructofuranosidase
VRNPSGTWTMFYTGSRFLQADSPANIETIGVATSSNLFDWVKAPDGPVCVADSRWYETFGTSIWPEEAWRDPWVFWRQEDQLWHMLITARGLSQHQLDRGVVGHATSPDLGTWTVQPPLSEAGAGFAHLEVFQIVEVNGQSHLVFCCDAAKLSGARAGGAGGVWTIPMKEGSLQVDVRQARLLVPEVLYAGRVIVDSAGRAWLLAFNNRVIDGEFIGGVSDPIALSIDLDGYLKVEVAP